MNVPSKRELLQVFNQQQREHPIGGIAARYVETALEKHPALVEEEKRVVKRRGQRRAKPAGAEEKGT